MLEERLHLTFSFLFISFIWKRRLTIKHRAFVDQMIFKIDHTKLDAIVNMPRVGSSEPDFLLMTSSLKLRYEGHQWEEINACRHHTWHIDRRIFYFFFLLLRENNERKNEDSISGQSFTISHKGPIKEWLIEDWFRWCGQPSRPVKENWWPLLELCFFFLMLELLRPSFPSL